MQLQDSLLNEGSMKSLAEMQTRFETERKENQITLLHKEKKIQGLQLSRAESQRQLLLIALVALLLLGVSAYYLLRLRQRMSLHRAKLQEQALRMKAILDTQEAERRRISSDLHDSLGQLLCVAQMNLSVLRKEDSGPSAPWNSLDQILHTAIQETRGLAHSLMPAVLVKLGLSEALVQFSDHLNSTGRLWAELQTDLPEGRLPEAVEVAVFRIVQELANNTLKHAEATRLLISLSYRQQMLSVTVEDNGKGFDPALLETAGGNGWHNIVSRVASLHGTSELNTGPDKGTTFRLQVPATVTAPIEFLEEVML